MNERREEMMSDEEFFEKFLAGKEWPPESEEDRRLTERIRQEMKDNAEKEEAMQQEDPELEGAEPDPDMLEKILGKARATSYHPEDYLTEEDRKALEIGRKKMHRSRYSGWFRHWSAMVAVLACVFIVGVSTDANRTKLVNVLSTWIGEDVLMRIDNETNREVADNEEEQADAEIEKKLGIKPVHFLYEVKGMEFNGYEIDEIACVAKLFYEYQGNILTIIMRKDDDGTSKGDIPDGTGGEIFDVPSDFGDLKVTSIEGTKQENYATKFVYNNTYYYFFGKISREELTKWLSSIFF